MSSRTMTNFRDVKKVHIFSVILVFLALSDLLAGTKILSY
jgi:hypothetical protein